MAAACLAMPLIARSGTLVFHKHPGRTCRESMVGMAHVKRAVNRKVGLGRRALVLVGSDSWWPGEGRVKAASGTTASTSTPACKT